MSGSCLLGPLRRNGMVHPKHLAPLCAPALTPQLSVANDKSSLLTVSLELLLQNSQCSLGRGPVEVYLRAQAMLSLIRFGTAVCNQTKTLDWSWHWLPAGLLKTWLEVRRPTPSAAYNDLS